VCIQVGKFILNVDLDFQGRQMFKKTNSIKHYKRLTKKIRTLVLSPFAKQVELMLIKEIISKVIEWILHQGM
jgi:hemerythrin superfamily protein